MMCGNCGKQAYQTVSGRGWEFCNVCARLDITSQPDVYWKPGMLEHGLPDDPNTGKPRIFESKRAKAQFLQENHLMEAGDRIRGSFPSVLDQQQVAPDNSREQVNRALAEVSKMGIDVRRQEFNRILKQTQGRKYG